MVKAACTALERGGFDEVIEMMEDMGLLENRDMFKKYKDDTKKKNYV